MDIVTLVNNLIEWQVNPGIAGLDLLSRALFGQVIDFRVPSL